MRATNSHAVMLTEQHRAAQIIQTTTKLTSMGREGVPVGHRQQTRYLGATETIERK